MSIAAILRATKRYTYGIYAWTALLVIIVPALAVLAVMPTRRWRRFVTHWAAKTYFALIASPVGIQGARLLPDAPCVLIANHASYLDGMILTAALPPRFTFLIKQEMASLPLAGYLLKRIGSEFVDREDGRHRHRVARRLLKAAQSGESLAFFPEGTFDAAPGLKRFQPGAFGAAWRARLPVVPVVISGSRAKMPAHVWLPAPGPVSIRVCEPVEPAAQDSAAELLSASRRRLLEWLEEPDLARTSVGSSPPADDP